MEGTFAYKYIKSRLTNYAIKESENSIMNLFMADSQSLIGIGGMDFND